jgi:PAS domain S-box-containing protein
MSVRSQRNYGIGAACMFFSAKLQRSISAKKQRCCSIKAIIKQRTAVTGIICGCFGKNEGVAMHTAVIDLADARFRALFDQAPISMLIYDPKGYPVRVNAVFTEQWGLTLPDIVASYCIFDDPQLVSAGVLPLIAQAFAGIPTVLPPFRYDASLVHPNGHLRWAQAYLYPIKDAANQVHEVVLMHVDVTALKAAELLARGQTTILTETLRQLAREPHLPAYLAHVLSAITKQVGAAFGYVLDYEARDHTLLLHTTVRAGLVMAGPVADDPALFQRPIPADLTPALQTMHVTRQPIRMSIAAHAPLFWPDLVAWHQTHGHCESIALALLAGETLVGVLGLAFYSAPQLSATDEDLLQALATQAALALQLTQLAERGRRLATLAERTRLAREIHDTLAQGLMGIIVQLQAANDPHIHDPADLQAHLNQALALARVSLAEARRSVQALRPPTLAEGDLGGALMRLLQQLTASAEVAASFALVGSPVALSPTIEGHLLRIGQEALHNALRHAQARHIRLELAFSTGRVRLQIRDDGSGFLVEQVPVDRYGLLGMRERAEQLGADLTIISAQGQGTTITVEAPIAMRTKEGWEDA